MKRQILLLTLCLAPASLAHAQRGQASGLVAPFPFLQQMEFSLGFSQSGGQGGMRFVSTQLRRGQGFFFDYGSLQPGAFTLGSGIANRQVSFMGLGYQMRRTAGRFFVTGGAGLYRADHEQPFFDSGPDRILSSQLGPGLRYGLGYQAGVVSLQLTLTHLPTPRTTDVLNRPLGALELGYRF